MAAATRRTTVVSAANRLPVPIKPHGNGTSCAPAGVVSSCTTAKISENASTARASPNVWRTMPHDAASANPAASSTAKNTKLPEQKHATANRAAAPSLATGFRRCSRLSPGTYSRNALMKASLFPLTRRARVARHTNLRPRS